VIHILYGADTLSRKEAFDALKASLDADGALTTNTVAFDAKAATPAEVIAACNTMPFLGEHRLVVLEGLFTAAPARRGRRKESAPEDDAGGAGRWQPLVEALDAMPTTTVLAIIDDKVLAGNPLLKAISAKAGAQVREFKLPQDRDLPGWVMARAKRTGLKIDAPAAKRLAELVGPDVWMLASEIDKLRAYKNGEVARKEDVEKMVSRVAEQKGYLLADAVATGQSAKAARILAELFEDGQPPQVLLATIAGRYRRMAIARDMLERGATSADVASQLGMKPGYGVEILIEQAERQDPDAYLRVLERLIEAELDVKVRGMDDQLALELAVQDLAGAPKIRTRA
jgi:DNA polymerase-3 subunit delta